MTEQTVSNQRRVTNRDSGDCPVCGAHTIIIDVIQTCDEKLMVFSYCNSCKSEFLSENNHHLLKRLMKGKQNEYES